MGRLLIAALAACFLLTARADEKPPGRPEEKPPAAGAGERKAARAGRTDRREGRAPSPKAETRGEAAPERQKPCEVVRPCPID
jgi:hypothetical protein